MKTRWLQTIKAAFIILLLTIAGMINVFAQEFNHGKLRYIIMDDACGVEVIRHIDGKNAKGDLVIPKTVTYNGITYSVISIGREAFVNCKELTSVIIPNSVTSIGQNAFRDCNGFTGSLTIPNSVTIIGSYAFKGCSGFKGNLTIPNSVKVIGPGAFLGCSGFTGTLIIPNSVTTILVQTFDDCKGLTSFIIPNSVTTIEYGAFLGTGWYDRQPNGILYLDGCCLGYKGNEPKGELKIRNDTRLIAGSAFSGCTDLTGTLNIPNSVTSIGPYAFGGCTGLTSVSIPNSITLIERSAFEDCKGLISVSIPNSVTYVDKSAFVGTGWYDRQPDGILYIDGCCLGYKGEKPRDKLIIKNHTRLIAGSAFYECMGLTSVTIPSSVTTIGKNAFAYCEGLTSVIIESHSLSKMTFNECFYGCYNLHESNVIYR